MSNIKEIIANKFISTYNELLKLHNNKQCKSNCIIRKHNKKQK